MRIRSFVIAYGLVLAILLFADRRPGLTQHDRYSHVLDLTDGQDRAAATVAATESRTHIIAPGALIPGTWSAGQIPPERLVAPLVVMDLSPAINQGSPKGSSPISLDDIAAWESRHGMIPQGAVIAIRRPGAADESATNDLSVADLPTAPFPVTRDAAMFLVEARYTIGFAVETPVTLAADRALAQQLALHGSYVVEGTARFTSLPVTGSLIIVAPARSNTAGTVPVRILAMVR